MTKQLSERMTLNNGVEMPRLGLGTYRIPHGEPLRLALQTALASGYRMFDTASSYENEEEVGDALRESGIPREQLFVSSKLWNSDHGYEKTLRAFEESRRKLKVDYLDLYVLHWPSSGYTQSWKALEKLVRDGWVRAIGTCHFIQRHLQPLLDKCEIAPALNQFEFHPVMSEVYGEYMPRRYEKLDMRLVAMTPLMRGRFAGYPVLEQLSAKYGKSVPQLILRWTLQQGVAAVPRSANPAHIRENASIFDFHISDEDMDAISSLNRSQSVR